MITVLIVAVSSSIIFSFLCSLMEAALYAVPLPHVKHLAEGGSRAGKKLLFFKQDIGKPIAAILILNTVANTVGAAIAGASVRTLWGDTALVLFSALLTLSILFFSEIIPKILGVIYCKRVAELMAFPLSLLIAIFYPLVQFSERISSYLKADDSPPRVSEEEVLSMAALGREEGTLNALEGDVISNVIGLENTLVRDVLTPRKEVFKLPEDAKLVDLEKGISDWQFTRVPLYALDDPDNLTSYVIQRDLYRAMIAGKKDIALKKIARPLHVVPELMSAEKLLFFLFDKGEHIVSAVDEHGALAGIITLEDLIEELVGREIVDEYDTE